MKIEIEQKKLADALKHMVGVVGKGDFTIHRAVRIRANRVEDAARGEGVWIECASGGMNLRIFVKCTVIEEGAIATPYARFAAIVNSFRGGILSITGGSTVKIASGSFKFSAGALDEELWPEITFDEEHATVVRLRAEAFAAMIKEVRFAARSKGDVGILTGVHAQLGDDGVLSVVCADGARMAFVRAASVVDSAGSPSPFGVVMTMGAVAKIVEMANAETETIALGVDGKKMRVIGSDWEFTACTLEGAFPKWEKCLLPREDAVGKCVCERGSLLQLLSCAESSSSGDFVAVRLKIGNGKLALETVGGDVVFKGDIVAEFDGEAVDIKVDARIFRQSVEMLSFKEKVELMSYGGSKPVFVDYDSMGGTLFMPLNV